MFNFLGGEEAGEVVQYDTLIYIYFFPYLLFFLFPHFSWLTPWLARLTWLAWLPGSLAHTLGRAHPHDVKSLNYVIDI